MTDTSLPVRDEGALLKLRRARTALLLKHPFFAALSMRLRLREDYHCRTAWTDGRFFAYNPHYINTLNGDKLQGLTAHIVMHPACNHHRRRQHRDPQLWNRACDYVINDILLAAGFTLPDGYLQDNELSDCSAEEAYDILIVRGNDQEEQEATEPGEQQQDNDSNEDNEQAEEPDGNSTQATESGAGDNNDPGMSGEVRDEGEGSGDGEVDDTQTNWDEAVIQASLLTRDMGSTPAGLQRFFAKRLAPRLCWRELLARFISASARSDYSWLSPNTRYLHQDLYLPSLKNHQLDEIVLALDTSGSITRDDLDRFIAELDAILAQHPSRLHLLCCDMNIHNETLVTAGEQLRTPELKGGGGTDFRPVFKHIDKNNIRPACLIYLTDLECLGYPAREPSYPVLWAQVGTVARTPPFGEVIRISETDNRTIN